MKSLPRLVTRIVAWNVAEGAAGIRVAGADVGLRGPAGAGVRDGVGAGHLGDVDVVHLEDAGAGALVTTLHTCVFLARTAEV